MVCQQCASPDIQKLSLVYENGLSHIATSSGGVGVGVGMGGIGVGVGGGRTRGTQVSVTALKAAPPKQRTSTGAVWMVIFAFIGLCCMAGSNEVRVVGLFFFGFATLGYFAMRSVGQYNRNVWPPLWHAWDAAYLCLRCGTMAAPRLTASAEPTHPTAIIEHQPEAIAEVRPEEPPEPGRLPEGS
jgi:hypothetical protein